MCFKGCWLNRDQTPPPGTLEDIFDISDDESDVPESGNGDVAMETASNAYVAS